MTLEQEQNLEQLLKNWREERHLTVENQRDGLMGNLCEEMAEYYRAINDDGKIDALCDISVFCINSLSKSIEEIKTEFKQILFLEKIENLYSISICINRNDLDKLDSQLYYFIKVIQSEIEEMGYDFYQCMLETIKEISSRTGNYDENIHKFVKDTTPEAVKNWHKADYSKCRITD